jgi:hypothetical protein
VIVATDVPRYDAYWNALRAVFQTGLPINVHPVVGPVLSQTRRTYVHLRDDFPTVGFTFDGFAATWLNAAQCVAYYATQALENPPVGLDRTAVLGALHQLGLVLNVNLLTAPPQPNILGLDDYMDLVDQ